MKPSIIVEEGACDHPSFGTTPETAPRKLFCSLVSDVALQALKASDQEEIRPEEVFEASNQPEATVYIRQSSGVQALAHMLRNHRVRASEQLQHRRATLNWRQSKYQKDKGALNAFVRDVLCKPSQCNQFDPAVAYVMRPITCKAQAMLLQGLPICKESPHVEIC